jgi:hypothetical protein
MWSGIFAGLLCLLGWGKSIQVYSSKKGHGRLQAKLSELSM